MVKGLARKEYQTEPPVQASVPSYIKTAMGWFCGGILAVFLSLGILAALFNATYEHPDYLLSVLKQNRYVDIQYNAISQALKKASESIGYDGAMMQNAISRKQVEQDVTEQFFLAALGKPLRPDQTALTEQLDVHMQSYLQQQNISVDTEFQRQLAFFSEKAAELYAEKVVIPDLYWLGRGLRLFEKGTFWLGYAFPFVLIVMAAVLGFFCRSPRKILRDISVCFLLTPGILWTLWAVCKKYKPWKAAITALGDSYAFLDYLGNDLTGLLFKTGIWAAGIGLLLFLISRKLWSKSI